MLPAAPAFKLQRRAAGSRRGRELRARPVAGALREHLDVDHERDGTETVRQSLPSASVASYYHGGVIGLSPGDRLLPPIETGSGSMHDAVTAAEAEFGQRNPRRLDLVYVTTHLGVAWFYALAGGAADRRAGAVYRVEPDGPLEADPDQRDSFGCKSATVRSVPYAEIPATAENKRRAKVIIQQFMAGG